MIRTPIFGVAGALLLSNANAKCVTEAYEIVGRVTDARGVAIAKAHVEISWAEHGPSRLRNTVVTDSSGQFAATIRFDPISGQASDHDICDAKLSSVVVGVSAAGYDSREEKIATSGRRVTANLSLSSK